MFRYIICLLIIVFGIQLAYAKPSTNTSQNGTQNSNGNFNSVAVQNTVSKIENKSDTENPTNDKEREARDDAFRTKQAQQNETIANATIWIAIFGGLGFIAALIYAIVSVLQWRQTKQFFDMTERPSLGIEGTIELIQDVNSNGFVEVMIRNSGKNPAIKVLTETSIGIQVAGKYVPMDCCPEPLKTEISGMKSQSIIPINGTTVLSADLTEKEFGQVVRGEVQFFVWIYVTYLKNKGQKKPYIFESYYRYRAETGVFIVCDTHNEAT